MKAVLRKEYIKKRLNMLQDDVQEKSNLIFEKIINSDIINNNVFALTYSYKNEVITHEITEYLLKTSKIVVFPKMIDGVMNFYEVKNMSEFKKGSFGIYEPISHKIYNKKNIDVIFTPGVVFSKTGYRIGFGGGYYDRYFKDYTGIKVGLCYEWQVLENFNIEEHDKKLDIIITEDNSYKM